MPAPYNLSGIDNALGIAEMYKATAQLAPAYLGNSIIATFFAIIFVGMISLKIPPRFALFSASIGSAFVSVLLFYFGLTGIITISITIGLTVVSAIWLAAVGE